MSARNGITPASASRRTNGTSVRDPAASKNAVTPCCPEPMTTAYPVLTGDSRVTATRTRYAYTSATPTLDHSQNSTAAARTNLPRNQSLSVDVLNPRRHEECQHGHEDA